MARWKVVIGFWIICMFCIPSFAQNAPRDYALSTPEVSYNEENTTFTVEFMVTNNGGTASDSAAINIVQDGVGRIEASDTLPPLAENEVVTVAFEFLMADFDAGEKFFAVEVGIDQFELAGSRIARDNRALFRVTIPENVSVPTTSVPIVEAVSDFDFVIPVVDVGINLLDDGIQINQDVYSNQQILVGVAILAAGLFLLWFLTLLLRLIFRRPAVFGTWQPPYAFNNYHDPSSTLGRRQGWQTHAQNGTIFEACSNNNVIALKRLTDIEGNILGTWDIKTMRTVQYDMYGRISRTEVIMPSKVIKRLNKVARRAPKYDNAKLRKAIQPIAKAISKHASKPISKRSAMLPIAMDIRFEGKHGEVRIMFELYQCRNGAWHVIDQWEPEMAIIGHKIVENYTYTLNGQLPDENYKSYKKRLVEDLAWVLSGMLYHHQQPDNPDPDMVPPDTLTGMAPITEGNMRPVDENAS